MHISQAEFAGMFNLARPSVGAYEEGRSEPKIDMIIVMASHFKISIDILLTRDLTVNEIFNLDQLNKKLDSVHLSDHNTEVESIESAKYKTPLLRLSQYLDYIVGFKNADFIHQLEHIQLPMAYDENVRAFEMNGSEMEYHQQGLHHGDVLIGYNHSIDNLNDSVGNVFCVVHKEQIFTRRLSEVNETQVSFESDDPHYQRIDLEKGDIFQLWKITEVISKYITKPSLLEERIMKLEKEMESIKKAN